MYFDPISAWLVALLFDGIGILDEKIRGEGAIEEYNRESITQMNKGLNGDIRRLKEKAHLIMPEQTLKHIQIYLRVAQNNCTYQSGYGEIVIDPDNQEYIIALLETCVKEYRDREKNVHNPKSADKYCAKADAYQNVIDKVKAQKEKQSKQHEETRIKKEKESQNANGFFIGCTIIAVALIILFAILVNN